VSKARRAEVAIAAAPVTLDPHRWTRGEHDGRAVRAWVIHVKEVDDAPAGVKKPLEWILLSNLPAATFGQACQLVDFYSCRPVIEDYHKAIKSGLGIEHMQFEQAQRLEPAVALLSVVGALLLELREAARQREADVTAATSIVPALIVRVLTARLHGQARDDLSVREFVIAVARLGGFLARKGDGLPGWQTLWRGWHNLQLLVAGAQLLRGGP
jgi:Transposase Tn5 dimerisation domain